MIRKSQLKKWEQQGAWNTIIREIEKLSSREQTPDLKLELANAYLNRMGGDWKKRKSAQKAVKILKSIGKYFMDDFLWHFSLGNAYYNLDQWSKAYFYLRLAKDFPQSDQFKEPINLLMSQYDINTLNPQFHQTFASRVEQAWTEFKKEEQDYRNSLRKDPGLESRISTRCESIFRQAVETTGVLAEFYKGRFVLTFTGDERENGLLQLFELQYLKDHAPMAIQRNWDINVGFPQGEIDYGKKGYVKFLVETLRLCILQPGHPQGPPAPPGNAAMQKRRTLKKHPLLLTGRCFRNTARNFFNKEAGAP